jgi:transposase
MAKQLITDELWAVIEPLLPPEPEKPRGGRPRIPNRDVLRGILFVLSLAHQVRTASRYALGLSPYRVCVDLLELHQPLGFVRCS